MEFSPDPSKQATEVLFSCKKNRANHPRRLRTLVRSHLDYCGVIYHVPSITHQPPLGMTLSSLMEKVERVQYQTALAITGAWQGSSRSKIYDELGRETSSDRRKGRRVLLINNIINNNTPSYLNEKITSVLQRNV